MPRLLSLEKFLKQALQGFNFLNFNLGEMGEADNCRILDNNQEHSISMNLSDGYSGLRPSPATVIAWTLNTLIQILDELPV